MAILKLNQGNLHYEVHGEGAPLVLLRGLGRSTRHWLGFVERMAKHFKVIILDARGIGQTTLRPTLNHSIYELADDVVAVLDVLEIKKAHIVGISLGGMVALAVGLKHADYCLSLTAINSSIGGTLYPRLTVRGLAVLCMGSTLGRTRFHALLADVLLGRECPPERRQHIIAEWKRIESFEGLPILSAVLQLKAAVMFNVKSKLPKIKVPTLVMYGTDDLFVPTWHSRLIHKLIPGSKLEAIAGAGHEAPLDCPERVEKVICKFVQGIKTPKRSKSAS